MKLAVGHIPRKAGVYQCTTPSGSYYIGRAADMKERVYQHHAYLKRGEHKNQRLQRSYDKYGGRLKWSVLFVADTVQTAIQWEDNYLQMFWGDPKLMNMRTGDGFTAEENERNKRKPVYAMNRDTGQYIKLNYVSEFGAMISEHRNKRMPNAIYAETLEQCKQQRLRYIREQLQREYLLAIDADCNEWDNTRKTMQRKRKYGYICRHVITGEHKYVERVDKPDCSDYWQARRTHAQWSKMKTQPKRVHGVHPIHGRRVWPSIAKCAKDLQRTTTGVYKVLKGTQLSCNGWYLTGSI